jgi:hypothetical protein
MASFCVSNVVVVPNTVVVLKAVDPPTLVCVRNTVVVAYIVALPADVINVVVVLKAVDPPILVCVKNVVVVLNAVVVALDVPVPLLVDPPACVPK